MMSIIVNADDLGVSSQVNNAIFELMATGAVTSATLLANGPAIDDACVRLKEFPRASFGVHLNVTEHFPLTTSSALAPLLEDTGNFGGRDMLPSLSLRKNLANAIFEEFCAQIDRLTGLGVPISHMDSHHHVHTIPSLFLVLKRVQRRYGIRTVRISRNIYGMNEIVSRSLLIKKAIFNMSLRHYYRTKTTEGFTDFLVFHEKSSGGELRCRTLEIMVHPGAASFQEESALLAGSWREYLELPFELINYRQLT